MIRRLTWALGGAAVLLGLGHLAIAAMAFERLSFDALWFVGSGIAIIVAGLFNLFAQGCSFGRAGHVLLGIANLSMILFFAMALTILPEPQVVLGVALFGGLAALSWRTGVTGGYRRVMGA